MILFDVHVPQELHRHQDMMSDHFPTIVRTLLSRKDIRYPHNLRRKSTSAYNQGTSILLTSFDPSRLDNHIRKSLQGLPCCIELSIRFWTTEFRALAIAITSHPTRWRGIDSRATSIVGPACANIARASQLSSSTSTITTALNHHGASPLHLTISILLRHGTVDILITCRPSQYLDLDRRVTPCPQPQRRVAIPSG
jgi:hypothetical protein